MLPPSPPRVSSAYEKRNKSMSPGQICTYGVDNRSIALLSHTGITIVRQSNAASRVNAANPRTANYIPLNKYNTTREDVFKGQ